MIAAKDLIAKFQHALNNKWGYIWGTAGVLWTTAKQKQKVNYMVSKYGTGWKNNSEAKGDNYYYAALYGDKWVGHYVADCSGLFAWAFKQLGGAIAHGSNSIWRKYCSDQGKIENGDIRVNLKPGTAVFTDKNGDKTHIGLYVGGGVVIEASGTKAGVITSNVNDTKWKCWGELKDVSYDGKVDPIDPSEDDMPTLRRGDKGEYVKILQEVLIKLGYDLGSYGADGKFGAKTELAVSSFQHDQGLPVDGVVGKATWDKLIEQGKLKETWTVTIPGLTEKQADALLKKYPDAWKKQGVE